MITAETAVALPALAVVVAGAAAVLSAVGLQARCVDEAGVVARAAARGDPVAGLAADARRDLPGAALSVADTGGMTTATVTVALHLPLDLGSVGVSGSASALTEPRAAAVAPPVAGGP